VWRNLPLNAADIVKQDRCAQSAIMRLCLKTLKAHKRDAEFEKCKSDPLSYLIQPVRGGAELGLD
jgi:hypothetical protein